MSDLNMIKIHDRIKETSNTTGTSNFVLEGASPGFSHFSDYVGQSGLTYYAITDGTNWEIGSGRFLDSGRNIGTFSSSQLVRFPSKSSNNNNVVDFGAGVKEVFVTYPSEAAVFGVGGLDASNPVPQKSGIAFWNNDNSINYSSNLLWDNSTSMLGINTNAPQYQIDVRSENPADSIIRSSGLILGESGVIFSGVNIVRQTEPFKRNETSALTNSNSVIWLSGAVHQTIHLERQAATHFLAGPTTGSPASYPSFRAIAATDLPALEDDYVLRASGDYYRQSILIVSGIAVTSSGALRASIGTVSGMALVASGVASSKAIASGFAQADINAATNSYSYNFNTTNTSNTIVNQSGFLTIPIFEDKAQLPTPISGIAGQVAILKYQGADAVDRQYMLAFCAPSGDGTGGQYVWWAPSGSHQMLYEPIVT